jgi:DNA-binding NarL/FixJ family response regulator
MGNGAILVVEDCELSASMIVELLRGAFPARQLHLATTASQGVSEFVRLRPSLLVTDIGLPDASGLEVTRRIAAVNPAALVVVYSADDGGLTREAAAAAGARAFVSKSNPLELLRVVAQLLDGRLEEPC